MVHVQVGTSAIGRAGERAHLPVSVRSAALIEPVNQADAAAESRADEKCEN